MAHPEFRRTESMRDVKQALGVAVFLLAAPAWASDMCPLGLLVFLPPIFLWVIVALVVGFRVKRAPAARVWTVLLTVGALPALGLAHLSFMGAFHGSELRHEEMLLPAVTSALALLGSYGWAMRRMLMIPSATPASP